MRSLLFFSGNPGPKSSFAWRFDSMPNPSQVDRIIARETARAERSGQPLSLVLFRTKPGRRHRASARRLARTIMSRARLTDDVGWFSDHYLCAVLPDTAPAGARIFADSVCALAAMRSPRPIAAIYTYPNHWLAVPEERVAEVVGQRGQVSPTQSVEEIAQRLVQAGSAHSSSRRESNNPDQSHNDHANHHGNGRHNGNGHALAATVHSPAHGNGADHNGGGPTAQMPHGSPTDDEPAAASSQGGVATATAVARIAPARKTLERKDLLPFVMQGMAIGLDSSTVQSLQSLLVRPMPWWKRTIDVVGALVGLAIFSPVLIGAALAIKLTSAGPIIFTQRRAGLGGKSFVIYKFRTMIADAEARKAQLRQHSEQDGPAFKLVNDPRITPIGKLLRKTSIDELPQFLNVLKGNMSLVGPRPLPIDEADACTAWQQRRLDVTPGLTCIWQIKGRSEVTFAEWIRMDVAYMRRRTLVHDVLILMKTVPAVLLRRGAK